jgi:hypothetical protein
MLLAESIGDVALEARVLRGRAAWHSAIGAAGCQYVNGLSSGRQCGKARRHGNGIHYAGRSVISARRRVMAARQDWPAKKISNTKTILNRNDLK